MHGSSAWVVHGGVGRLDLGFGGGLDGGGEEVVGLVSCEMENYFVGFYLGGVC